MNEAVLSKVFETSIIAGAFIYLLIYMLKDKTLLTSAQIKQNEIVAQHLEDFGKSLKEVSITLLRIDTRLEQLEKRVDELEEVKGNG